jgi:predicted GNAT family N-acyltransferase
MRVFIDEQGVDASEEIDEHEATAIHVVVVDEGRVVATCRLRRVGADMKLERMAVERDTRGGGVGTELLREAERIAAAEGAARMLMHAQTRARGFYASNAYEPEGELFFEAGIEHVRMTKAL